MSARERDVDTSTSSAALARQVRQDAVRVAAEALHQWLGWCPGDLTCLGASEHERSQATAVVDALLAAGWRAPDTDGDRDTTRMGLRNTEEDR